ncbi:hypothetical protein [Ralstonia pseudosolanacearum]|uniref:hypothetical protein n=1 Tax=Ralstonia pseudosolanacearum TaxID=1310165 RepID=UPI001FFACF8C|nr:hypothetical protein [Ralstonia pseudosolanacearum]
MPAGLQIWNDAGTVLIDDTHANLAVAARGVVATSAAGMGVYQIGSRAVVSYTGDTRATPLIAFACPAGFVGVYLSSLSGSTYTWRFITEQPAGTEIKYWVFDRAPASSGSYGFQVFDAAGNLTFDSSRQQARIVGITGGIFEIPAGRIYAVAVQRIGYAVRVYPASEGGRTFEYDIDVGAAHVQSGRIVVGEVGASSQIVQGTRPGFESMYPMAWIVLDVTGM